MIDLHCHVLAGIDDGAGTLDESIALVKLAVEQGVSRIVATPHIHFGRFDNSKSVIEKALKQLNEAVAEQGVDIELAAAAEVRLTGELPLLIDKSVIPFLGVYQGNQVLLLELPHSHIPTGTDRLIKWLANRNILPMIAHPERNRELQQHPERIRIFTEHKCLFQLTAASLLNDMSEQAQVLAEHWLQQRLYSIVASDSHSLKRRPPKMTEAFAKVVELTDKDYAQQLFVVTPKIISDALFTGEPSVQCGVHG